MLIRAATEKDIPTIVELLRLSLGEGLMPKSIAYWRWKHIENPFGVSPVLTCWEGDTLIGVRAFMRWEWTFGGKIYKALRAVDTATHPEHQGKGIFKKLSMALVDECKKNGDHFIFNTPNEQSKPGYLKMGWQEAGKLPVAVGIQRPLKMLKNIILQSARGGELNNTKSIQYYLEHSDLSSLIPKNAPGLITNYSISYLLWRYLHVPVADYVAIGDEQGGKLNGLMIGRLKTSRLGLELRVTDFFLTPAVSSEGLLQKIKEFKKTNAVDYCTLSGFARKDQVQSLGIIRWKGSFGPIVTIRSLGLTDLGILQNFNHWSPSLGDLELF